MWFTETEKGGVRGKEQGMGVAFFPPEWVDRLGGLVRGMLDQNSVRVLGAVVGFWMEGSV